MMAKKFSIMALFISIAILILLFMDRDTSCHDSIVRPLEEKVRTLEEQHQKFVRNIQELLVRLRPANPNDISEKSTPTEPVREALSEFSTDEAVSENPIPTWNYRGDKISLRLDNVPLKQAIVSICLLGNISVAVGNDVEGRISLDLKDVPWDKALNDLLQQNGLDKIQEGNVIRVARAETLENERIVLQQLDQQIYDYLHTR